MNDVIFTYVRRATCKLDRPSSWFISMQQMPRHHGKPRTYSQRADRVSNLRLAQDILILDRTETVSDYIYFIVNNCHSRNVKVYVFEK
jgi:hypothetical protein